MISCFSIVLVITRIGLDADTNIPIGRNSIQIASDSFLGKFIGWKIRKHHSKSSRSVFEYLVETTILILADLNCAKTSHK